MTYGEIYKEFSNKVKIDDKIDDWRPCNELYGVPFIPYAIVIGLEGGNKIIYISDKARQEDLKYNG